MTDMVFLVPAGRTQRAREIVERYQGVTRVRMAYSLPGGDGLIVDASGTPKELATLYDSLRGNYPNARGYMVAE